MVLLREDVYLIEWGGFSRLGVNYKTGKWGQSRSQCNGGEGAGY